MVRTTIHQSNLWRTILKKTLIAFAILALSGVSFANVDAESPPPSSTCNGTLACSGNPTVGDNRNGQTVGVGQIANGGQIIGGSATTTSGAATTTGGSANTMSGAATTTSGAAITTSGSANTMSGAANSTSTSGSTSGNSTSTSGSTSGAATTSNGAGAGAITNTNSGYSTSGSTSGAASTTSGAITASGGTNSNAGINGQSSVSGVAGVNGGINISSAMTADVAGIQAQADRDVARTNADAARYATDRQLRNTPSVATAALTSSNDTCMGSVSAGGSGPGFSLAIGSTYKDDNCVMLKNSREMWNMGFKAAAMALMCTDKANREALELTGFVCPQTARDQQRTSSNATAQSPEYTDPIVRSRMGLPPLK